MSFSEAEEGHEVVLDINPQGKGTTLIECPCCEACYSVPSAAIPGAGREVKCSNCGHVWFFRRETSAHPSKSSVAEVRPVAAGGGETGAVCIQVNTRPSVIESEAVPKITPNEVRMLISGSEGAFRSFIKSQRIHAVDAKGDTALHIVARLGSLSACDLFIQAGADPKALNNERQTPADVALAEGHSLVAELLSTLVTNAPEMVTDIEREVSPLGKTRVVGSEADRGQRNNFSFGSEPASATADLKNLLDFEPEAEPEQFFDQSVRDRASGTFVALGSSSTVVSDQAEADWELDLSAAPIAGDGIGSNVAADVDQGTESDFLKVRSRGRQSIKRAVVQTGTRMSIDLGLCFTWADEILAKGRCSLDDIDRLVADCEGNGDLGELRINLQRNLESAGFDLAQATGHDADLWDIVSDISSDDLADSIEAALTRRTRLPGTQRFVMDKSEELQLLEPMMRAKQELQLGILASETAVETILDVMDRIRDGSRDPGSVSLRIIIPSRPGHAETSEVMAAADALRSWRTTGRVMDGKQRREALAALEALDFSLAFHKELVRRLEQAPRCQAEASKLEAEILISEAATEQLIREHLPYVRRFASRNVEEGEDPEDVFQVAFMGLQRSTRRFDPERGFRFLIYASYWMRQAITRWRSDEGALIRIPVHRNEKITKLDRALDRLDVWASGAVSDFELAAVLEWTVDEVSQLRSIPREPEYPDSLDGWDDLLPEPSDVDVIDQAETEWIVHDALADLPEREADVIRMRFGIGRDSDMTLEEIGQIYGVTRERIRQIEAKGLDRLSHPGRKRRLQELLGL